MVGPPVERLLDRGLPDGQIEAGQTVDQVDADIVEAGGAVRQIASGPRSGLNADLIQVGAGYGVIKAVFQDDPHWSNDGH